MSMISRTNPEYNAKPWLAKSSSQSLPTAGGQKLFAPAPVFTTPAWIRKRLGMQIEENPSGCYGKNPPPSSLAKFIESWNTFINSWPNFKLNNDLADSEMDPYTMVQNPWMPTTSSSPRTSTFSWQA